MVISREKQRELLLKFHRMDLNNDCCLDRKEVHACIVSSNLPESQVERFMQLFDLNGDGKVTLEEYVLALGLKPIPKTEYQDWKFAFESIDADGSNYLDRMEVRELVHRLGYSECSDYELDQWMAEVDTDRDGAVSFPEFCAFMETAIRNNC